MEKLFYEGESVEKNAGFIECSSCPVFQKDFEMCNVCDIKYYIDLYSQYLRFRVKQIPGCFV